MSIEILQERIRTLKNPIILSLAPTLELIPPHLLAEADAPGDAAQRFCLGLLDAFQGIVPGVCFSIPAFLALSPVGFAMLPPLMLRARELGYYVLLDGLGDTWGNLGQAMADAVFGPDATYPADGVILGGYCGQDSISSWLPYCKNGNHTLFVLAKSPNRSAVEIQDLYLGGRLVHTAMADLIGHWGSDGKMTGGYTPVGAVVGAPYPESIRNLREKYTRMFLLVTGVDSSRASPKKCTPAFDRFGHGAAVCVGPMLMGAWRSEDGTDGDGHDYQERAVEVAKKLLKNLTRYITIL